MSAIRIASSAAALPQGELFSIKKGRRHQGSCIFAVSTLFGKQLSSVALWQKKCSSNRRWGLAVASLDKGSSLPGTHKIKTSSLEAFQQLRTLGADRYTSEKSSILVLGLSVHTAPVQMREKLALPEAEWPRAIEELCNQNHIEEAAVLSTCNRMEIYVVALSWHRGIREITEWMSKTSGIPVGELREHLFILQNRDATEHLFRVASGLDSLILGEGQILAQVKQVYKIGQGAVGFGRCLSGLFKQSITAGKRVRSETSIAAGAVSVSSAAVELAMMKLPKGGLLAARVLVVGAGKMSKLLIKHLVSKGCSKLIIVNRSEQRVMELQNEFSEAEVVYQPLSKLLECAGKADVIFTSTASESPIFHKEDVLSLEAPSDAVAGIRCFIDISVPRNVSVCVSEISSVQLFNVDDLREVVEANKEERKRKALEAQSIIEEELKSFEAWRDSLETVPTIKKLRAYAEKIRVSELEKCLSKFGDISAKNRKLIDELSRGIVNKLLHGPMQHLRTDATNTRTVGEVVENMHALERMFDLEADSASLELFRSKVEKLSE